MKTINFEDVTLRLKTSSRGGGIEISLDYLGKKYQGHKMTAYQNYLGGGMLGAIGNDCTFPNWKETTTLTKTAENLARYFHDLTNHEEDEWESATFEQNQNRPVAAY